MAASFQEQFVSALAEVSIGAQSLFEPDVYRKGSAIREPADLAWYCRDTVILMHMQASNKGQTKEDLHNLKQLRGWLRAWSSGQKLEGHNSVQSFSIDLKDVATVLGVSVTGDPNAEVVVHNGGGPKVLSVDDRLVAVASVPEGLLLQLAQLGGTSVDLVDLLLRIAAEGGRASLPTASRYLHEQHALSLERAAIDPRLRDDRDAVLDGWLQSILIAGLRGAAVTNVDNRTAGLEAFNDLDWQNAAILSRFSADVFRSVRDVERGAYGPVFAGNVIGLGPYRILVLACDFAEHARWLEAYSKTVASFETENEGVPTFIVQWLIEGRPVVRMASVILTFPPVMPYATQITQSLTEIRALIGTGANDARTGAPGQHP